MSRSGSAADGVRSRWLQPADMLPTLGAASRSGSFGQQPGGNLETGLRGGNVSGWLSMYGSAPFLCTAFRSTVVETPVISTFRQSVSGC
jgi:hypothetical protein